MRRGASYQEDFGIKPEGGEPAFSFLRLLSLPMKLMRYRREYERCYQNAKTLPPLTSDTATNLEPLPESLRQALIANGADPDLPSVKSAEAWSPSAAVDFNDPDQQAETEKLVAETLKRMGANNRG